MSGVDWDEGFPKDESTANALIISASPKEEDSVTYEWTKAADGADVKKDGVPFTKYRLALTRALADVEVPAGTKIRITPISTVDGVVTKGTPKEVEVKDFGGSNTSPSPTIWDGKFATPVLIGSLSFCALIIVLLVVGLFALGPRLNLAWTVALVLLALASVLAVVASTVALLEIRGRATLTAAAASRDFGDGWADKAPEILKNWGGLGVTSAMLALAGFAIIGASTIGYRSLPDPTPSASSSASPSSSASASAVPEPSSLESPTPDATR